MVLPEEDTDMSLNADGAVSYAGLDNNSIIGGTIVNINSESALLLVKAGVQSKGVVIYIRNEIEALYPDKGI